MSERLSMMPGYCTEHDLRFDRLGCQICVMDKFDDPRPTPSPEAQAVLEAAVCWYRDPLDGGRVDTLQSALDAYVATQKPKDYAPDCLKTGTRFRFAEDHKPDIALYGDIFRLAADYRTGKFYCVRERDWAFDHMQPDHRLIPLPEQDG